MSIAAVVTRGYSIGSIAQVVTRGYSAGMALAATIGAIIVSMDEPTVIVGLD